MRLPRLSTSPLCALAALALIAPLSALAAPELLPVHGNLTDADGNLIEGQQELTFTLYSDAAGTEPVWTDTQTVELLSGNFTAYLGGAEPLDLALFRDTEELWLGVRVGDDEETGLARLGSVGFAGFAQFAGDALALDGVLADELFDSIPDQIAVEDWAKAVCFDTVDELSAELDPLYALQAGDGIDLTGNVVSVVETDLKALLDDDYGFSAGTGLALDTATLEFSVEEQDLKDLLDDDYALTFGDGLELDTATMEVAIVEDDLTDLLDDNYLELEYVPDFGDLTGVPTGLADGDDDTTYTAGDGLALSGTEFSVVEADLTALLDDDYKPVAGTGITVSGTTISANKSVIEGWAKAVAYDTEKELTDLLDDDYKPVAGTGISVSGTTISANQTVIEGWAKGVAYDTEAELTGALDDTYANVDGDTFTDDMTFEEDVAVEGTLTVDGGLESAAGRVQRDIAVWSTTTRSSTPIHIKTNIKVRTNVMYKIMVEGYNYGNAQSINSEVVGYTFSGWSCFGNNRQYNYAGGVSISQYCSSDGYVVVRLSPGDSYYMGFSVSGMFVNPAGSTHKLSVTIAQRSSNF